MKELERHKPDQKIIVPAEEKTERFLGRYLLKPGQKVWRWKDGEVDVAPTDPIVIPDKDGGHTKKHKLRMESDCYYFPALNKKNAIKKFRRSGLTVNE